MASKPTFTIVVPFFNSADTLRTTIESILAQTYKNFELVLINDGSTDHLSLSICKSFAKQHSNIKVYTYHNGGVACARKHGIKKATGDYIIFVDSDDTVNSDLLEKLASTIEANPSSTIDVIRYQVNLIGDEDYKDHDRHNYREQFNELISGLDAIRTWSDSNKKYALYWLYAFRREHLTSLPAMPNLRCFEDVAYIPIIIANAKNVVTIDFVGYNYTCNRDDSLTNEDNISKVQSRAKDFYKACLYAVTYFKKVPGVTDEDIKLFAEDYKARAEGYYYSLSDFLRIALSDMYNLPAIKGWGDSDEDP